MCKVTAMPVVKGRGDTPLAAGTPWLWEGNQTEERSLVLLWESRSSS